MIFSYVNQNISHKVKKKKMVNKSLNLWGKKSGFLHVYKYTNQFNKNKT